MNAHTPTKMTAISILALENGIPESAVADPRACIDWLNCVTLTTVEQAVVDEAQADLDAADGIYYKNGIAYSVDSAMMDMDALDQMVYRMYLEGMV